MRMLCYKCNHPWNYGGKNSDGKGYITCPGCYYKIRVDKALVEEPFKQELLTSETKLPRRLLSFKTEIPTTHHPKPLEIKGPIETKILEEFQDQEEDQEIDEEEPQIILTNILHANPVNIECIRN